MRMRLHIDPVAWTVERDALKIAVDHDAALVWLAFVARGTLSHADVLKAVHGRDCRRYRLATTASKILVRRVSWQAYRLGLEIRLVEHLTWMLVERDNAGSFTSTGARAAA